MNVKIDKLIAVLEPHVKDVEKPKDPSLDASEMWKWLVIQICVRGGSQAIYSLTERGEMDEFLSQLSLDKMPLPYEEVLKVLSDFKATRFRPSASKTITENYHRCFSAKKFMFTDLLTENIPKRQLTKKRVDAERRVRNDLRSRFVWAFRRGNEWKVHNWKNKPISDWLKDIGFAITLMPFDTRVRKILKELGIRATDENYEDVEDIFVKQICPRLGILPIQIDRIFYEKYDRIISSLRVSPRKLNYYSQMYYK